MCNASKKWVQNCFTLCCFSRFVMMDHRKLEDIIWPTPHIAISQFRFASFKVSNVITTDLPVIAKASAEVDIKGLGDVYGVLNGDKDRPNLGRWVKTLPTLLNLEEQEFIWNWQIGFMSWEPLLRFHNFQFTLRFLRFSVSPWLEYQSRQVGWVSWAISLGCLSPPFVIEIIVEM